MTDTLWYLYCVGASLFALVILASRLPDYRDNPVLFLAACVCWPALTAGVFYLLAGRLFRRRYIKVE